MHQPLEFVFFVLELSAMGVLRFFNTNNLWVDLEALAKQFKDKGGALELPVMKLLGEFVQLGVGYEGLRGRQSMSVCLFEGIRCRLKGSQQEGHQIQINEKSSRL